MKQCLLASLLLSVAATAATAIEPVTHQAPDPLEDRLIEIQRHEPNLSWILTEPPAYARQSKTQAEGSGAGRLAALAEAARRDGLDKAPKVATELQAVATLVLAEAQRQAIMARIRVTDAEISARIKAAPGLYDAYRLSHIFIASDDKSRSDADALTRARELRDRLAKGETFEALAIAESDDKSTAAEGGMLSTMFGVYMVDAFVPAVQRLAEGEVSAPVKGPKGYHLIRLEQRDKTSPEQVHFLAEEAIRGERFASAIEAATRAAASARSGQGADAQR